MPLTDTQIRQAKPRPKPIKMFDGGGMFLFLNPNGSRWWRLKYRVDGLRSARAVVAITGEVA